MCSEVTVIINEWKLVTYSVLKSKDSVSLIYKPEGTTVVIIVIMIIIIITTVKIFFPFS